MKWEYIGTGLALVAIGLTLMVALPPPWAPKMSPHLVQVGILGGLVLALVGAAMIAVGVWPGIPEKTVAPIFLLVLGGLFFITGSIWLYSRLGRSEARELAAFNLVLECSTAGVSFPAVVPPDGTIPIFTAATMMDKGGIAGGSRGGTPGEKWDWPVDFTKFQSLAKCRVINYGQSPIFNIGIPATARFIKIEKGESEGSFTAKQLGPILRHDLKLEPGKDNAAFFYVHNQSLFVAQFSFGDLANYYPAGQTKQRQVQVVQATDLTRTFSLWPNHDTKDIVGATPPK